MIWLPSDMKSNERTQSSCPIKQWLTTNSEWSILKSFIYNCILLFDKPVANKRALLWDKTVILRDKHNMLSKLIVWKQCDLSKKRKTLLVINIKFNMYCLNLYQYIYLFEKYIKSDIL